MISIQKALVITIDVRYQGSVGRDESSDWY